MKQTDGSATLIVLLVLSAIIFGLFNLFKSTALTVDLALTRQEREQKARMTHGVLNYGIDLYSKRFSSLIKNGSDGKNKMTLEVGTWKLEGHPPYTGQLDIALQGKTVQLQASLLHEQKSVYRMSCNLKRKEKGGKQMFVVSNWKENTL